MSTGRPMGCKDGECAVQPLFLFNNTDWKEDAYDFDFEVSLIRADAKTLESIYSNLYALRFPADSEPEWLFVTRWFPHPREKDTASSVVADFATSFLMALNLVHANWGLVGTGSGAVFRGRKAGDALVRVDPDKSDLLRYVDFPWPHPHWPETFRESDLDLLRKIWPALVNLLYAGPREGERDESKRDKRTGEELYVITDPDFEIFAKEGGGTAFAKTRLGRALGMFHMGSRLPILPGFVMMSVVLETLYLCPGDKEERKSVIVGRRLAAALGGEDRNHHSELHTMARQVYKARNEIVHGGRMMTKIGEKTGKNAFALARTSLQHILCEGDIFRRYTDKHGEEIPLRTYFLELDKSYK